MSMEIGKINEGIVKDHKSLSVLLGEEVPSVTTKKRDPYYFQKETINLLGRKLPREVHALLKLPILFVKSPDVPDCCSCSDETAFRALQLLGEISGMCTLQDGCFWVSRVIAYAILRKYPTAVQVVMGP
jgi:uncharacterized protein (UPF0216 family)